jgi:hypothetical protein
MALCPTRDCFVGYSLKPRLVLGAVVRRFIPIRHRIVRPTGHLPSAGPTVF